MKPNQERSCDSPSTVLEVGASRAYQTAAVCVKSPSPDEGEQYFMEVKYKSLKPSAAAY